MLLNAGCIHMFVVVWNLLISGFVLLSQNYQHLFDKLIHASYSKLSKELKNDIEILVG